MAGGLMQLVAYGEQDTYLTGNPQVTFFKVVYRRHTNFSMESVVQNLEGSDGNISVNLNNIDRFNWKITKNGDLLSNLHLNMTMECAYSNISGIKSTSIDDKNCPCPKSIDCNTTITNLNNDNQVIWNPTHNIIDFIQCNIGGLKIDKQSGQWMEIWSQLTESNNDGYIGNIATMEGTEYQKLTKSGGMCHYDFTSIKLNASQTSNFKPTVKFDAIVPLQFWFCKYMGLALPLVALQYHDIDICMEVNKDSLKVNGVNGDSGINLIKNELWANYIYLDQEERRRFAQVSHEYLIEQIQHLNVKGPIGEIYQPINHIDIKFNHPIKELIWTGKYNKENGYQESLMGKYYDKNASNGYYDNPVRYQLKLNGLDRFTERKLEYFTEQQIYEYHTGKPVPTPSFDVYELGHNASHSFNEFSQGWSNDSIAVYSFALKPEDHQPSGTCNFTKIESAQLFINHTSMSKELNDRIYTNEYNIYAINYNVLRIMSGMGGLVYSN
jgi:hypothetical protein